MNFEGFRKRSACRRREGRRTKHRMKKDAESTVRQRVQFMGLI